MEYKLEYLEPISESSTVFQDEINPYPHSSEPRYLLDAFPLEQGLQKNKRIPKKRPRDSESLRNLKNQYEELLDNHEVSESEAKRLQQIVRNRISAQQSRDRKKRYLQSLEQENQEFKAQKTQLLARIKDLETENKHLKNQLMQIPLDGDAGTVKASALSLATVLSIMVLVNSLSLIHI